MVFLLLSLDIISFVLTQQACSILNVDIISLKLDERLPFKLKYPQVGQVCTLFCYSVAETNGVL